MAPDIFAELEAEQGALARVLERLDESAGQQPSAAEGWTISDVVLHLAQTEEVVVASATGSSVNRFPDIDASTTDEMAAAWVDAERGPPFGNVIERWSAASRGAVEALREADPDVPLTWVATPLKPRTLATTRLAEHWIHAQDITSPLQIPYPDTDRLWHIAWLAHRTIPYAFTRAGADSPPSVRLDLTAPSGDAWSFGDSDAPCRITGTASDFCRIAGRRLDPADAASVRSTGERHQEVLNLVRTYA